MSCLYPSADCQLKLNVTCFVFLQENRPVPEPGPNGVFTGRVVQLVDLKLYFYVYACVNGYCIGCRQRARLQTDSDNICTLPTEPETSSQRPFQHSCSSNNYSSCEYPMYLLYLRKDNGQGKWPSVEKPVLMLYVERVPVFQFLS